MKFEYNYLNIPRKGLGRFFTREEGMPVAEETKLSQARSCPASSSHRRNCAQVGLTAGLGSLFNIPELYKKTVSLSMVVIVLIAATAFAADTDWFEEGRKFQAQKNYAEAVDCFNKAVEESPDNVRAWNRLAVCYLSSRNLDRTVDVCELTVDKWPNNILAANNYSFIISVKTDVISKNTQTEKCPKKLTSKN